jgi:hypothetical protein
VQRADLVYGRLGFESEMKKTLEGFVIR